MNGVFYTHNNIILYHVLIIIYLWISTISLVSIVLKLTENIFTSTMNPVFFILSIVKSIEILP